MKKLTSMLLAVLMGCMFSVSAFAQEPVESPVPDEISIVFDETGIHGASIISRQNGPINPNMRASYRLSPNDTIELGDNGGYFYLVAGQKINMIFSYTPKGAEVAFGYMMDGGGDQIVGTTTSGSIKRTFRITEDGYYAFWITSMYDGYITLNGSMSSAFALQ